MTQGIDTIVFDIGNVLIQWDPRFLYRKLFKDPEETEWFLTHICSSDWNRRQDEGRPWDDGIAELVARFPDFAPQIRAYRERWDEMVPGPVDGMTEIFEAIGQVGYKRYAISNFAEDTFRLMQDRFPILRAFDGIALSGQLKMLKPDPAIYRWLIAAFHITPQHALVIDDIPENVEAAETLGFRAVLFRDAEQLTDALAEHGVGLVRASAA